MNLKRYMLIKKMDNNMTAIVSVIMLGLGFINGMVISTLIDKYEVGRMSFLLLKSDDKIAKLEKQIDDLKYDLEYETDAKEELLSKMNSLIREYTSLPPPPGPLERSQVCNGEDDMDAEHPTSPDLNPNNKD